MVLLRWSEGRRGVARPVGAKNRVVAGQLPAEGKATPKRAAELLEQVVVWTNEVISIPKHSVTRWRRPVASKCVHGHGIGQAGATAGAGPRLAGGAAG